ncbi:MAG: DsbA family protein [Anaerolineae bacterium]|nr:DsbA family protein [Anaerolineae bacterium]
MEDSTTEYVEIEPEKNSQIDKHASQTAMIASLFLIIGILIGAFGYDAFIKSQRDIIEEVIEEVIAAQFDGQDTRIAETVVTTLLDNVQGQRQPERAAPGAGPRRDVDDDGDPAIGSADAPVVIIEFSDFRCPYCGRFATTTMGPLLEEYGDYVYFVYRDFAILGAESVSAAIAAECANEQGEFWAYHDLLFANQQNLNQSAYIAFAGELGLDVDAFTGCIDNETYLAEVRADTAAAQQLGATGTPTFYINGRFVSGAQPYEVFAAIIEEELVAAGIEFD